MRIIAGKLKSRLYKSPPGNRSHPMSSRARTAIFNSLGDLEGLKILDAYAGGGSLGLESLSRGAELVQFVEIDKLAYKTLLDNIESLDLQDSTKATRANIFTWAQNNPSEYDIVFCDPPYNQVDPRHIEILLQQVKPTGLFVLSHPAYFRPNIDQKCWQLESAKNYSAACVKIYRRLK